MNFVRRLLRCGPAQSSMPPQPPPPSTESSKSSPLSDSSPLLPLPRSTRSLKASPPLQSLRSLQPSSPSQPAQSASHQPQTSSSTTLPPNLLDSPQPPQLSFTSVNSAKSMLSSSVPASSGAPPKGVKSRRKVPALMFIGSFQATLYAQKVPEVLPTSKWEAFLEWQLRAKGQDLLSLGLEKKDMAAFYNYLRDYGTRINMTVLSPNRQKAKFPNIAKLENIARELIPGWYLVHAGDNATDRCFALGAFGSLVMPAIIDGYKESESPSCQIVPLDSAQWIRYVRGIRRVVLMPETWVFKPNKRIRRSK